MTVPVNEAPRVTIGMPIFNNGATLARAIASVRGQTVENWRLILSDDRSSDDSWQIAEAAAVGDPRITAIRNPSRLEYMNFSVALRDADTEWFVWLAADDFWAPRFLEATMMMAARAPEAVSILPRWAFQGLADTGAGEMQTALTDPTPSVRIRQFLAAPGGTRMYGLSRTDVVRDAFPRRSMHAYDWYLMLGILRAGPQVCLHGDPLLFRHRTPLRSYAEASRQRHKLLPSLPGLRMSLAALMNGRVPLANLPDLAWLNLKLHEEYLVHIHPAVYARLLGLFRALNCPIATKPERAARIAADLIDAVPERRAGAERLLKALIAWGDAAAARVLAEARETGQVQGDAADAFRDAARLGDCDARAIWLHHAFQTGDLSEGRYWAALLDSYQDGSKVAQDALTEALQNDDLPPSVAAAIGHRLRGHLA